MTSETPVSRLRVTHETGYSYAAPVSESYNEARVTPHTDQWQLTLDARVDVEPRARVRTYWDYWGNYVSAFDVHEPHVALTVRATSLVETSWRPPPGRGIEWSALRTEATREAYLEYLAPTSSVPVSAELVEVAADLAATATRPSDAAETVAAWVRDAITYRPGVTGVHTSAVEAWEAGQGVCQDFAHLTLLLLRAVGIPARYISGYLHPARTVEPFVPAVGESHAWIEFWSGDWWPLDPTNGRRVGADHVLVARGRDYGDVAPLRGIYSGGESTALGVTVEMTALPPGRDG